MGKQLDKKPLVGESKVGHPARRACNSPPPTADLERSMLNQEQPSPSDSTPEKALLIGIVERAIRDAAPRLKQFDTPRADIKRDAMNWLLATTSRPFSFRWICNQLEVCHATALRRILVLLKDLPEEGLVQDKMTKLNRKLEAVLRNDETNELIIPPPAKPRE